VATCDSPIGGGGGSGTHNNKCDIKECDWDDNANNESSIVASGSTGGKEPLLEKFPCFGINTN